MLVQCTAEGVRYGATRLTPSSREPRRWEAGAKFE
jgi:hypothetical protein